jgi:hypothetical protein
LPHSQHTYQDPINFNASGDNTVIAAPASGAIKVYAIAFTVNGATVLTYKHSTTALTGSMVLTGNGSSMTLPLQEEPWFTCKPGEAFVMNSSNAVTFGGSIWYGY